MPAYDYVCQDCGKAFEKQITMDQYARGVKVTCPDCRSRKAIRTFTPPNVVVARGGGSGPAFGCGPAAGPGCCG